jgi:hypothetical protein
MDMNDDKSLEAFTLAIAAAATDPRFSVSRVLDVVDIAWRHSDWRQNPEMRSLLGGTIDLVGKKYFEVFVGNELDYLVAIRVDLMKGGAA